MLRIEAMSRYRPHMLNGSLFVSENKFYLLKCINTSDQTPVTWTGQGTGQLLLGSCGL